MYSTIHQSNLLGMEEMQRRMDGYVEEMVLKQAPIHTYIHYADVKTSSDAVISN